MEEIRLVEPSIGHQGAVEGLKKEFLDRGECFIHGSALLHQMEYPEWLRALRDNGDPHTVREGRAVASTFLAMRARDERLVGLIDVRHSLDTDFFLRYGGHIGYAEAVRTAQGLWCRHAAAGSRLRVGDRAGGGHGELRFRQSRFSENDRGVRGKAGRVGAVRRWPDVAHLLDCAVVPLCFSLSSVEFFRFPPSLRTPFPFGLLACVCRAPVPPMPKGRAGRC